MQILKFKIQSTVTLFTAINRYSRPLSMVQLGQKVMFVHYDWRIWIHFVGFCIFCSQPVVAAIIMIDSSKICKSLVGLKFRVCTVHDLERHSKNYGYEY